MKFQCYKKNYVEIQNEYMNMNLNFDFGLGNFMFSINYYIKY